jgi:hypothetical protein
VFEVLSGLNGINLKRNKQKFATEAHPLKVESRQKDPL